MLKCVGSDGKVEYAAQCPTGTKQVDTGIRNAPAAPSAKGGAAQPKSLAEREAEFKKRQLEGAEAREKAEKKASESAQNQEACQQAKGNLQALQDGQRITKIDPKTGERMFIDDAERP